MQRVDMPKSDSPDEYGKIIEGPKPKVDRKLAAERLTPPEQEAPERRVSLPARRTPPPVSGGWFPNITAGTGAAILAFLWVLTGLAVLTGLQAQGRLFTLSFSDWVMMGLGLMVPLAVLTLVVQVIRRAADMRRAAMALARLAAKLTEPDKTSAAEVGTLGASIRAELDRVTASLDHAVRRVSALESMLKDQTRSLDTAADRMDQKVKSVGETLDAQRSKLDKAATGLASEAKAISEAVDAQAGTIAGAATKASDQIKSAQATLDERTRALDGAAVHAVRRTHEATKGLDDQTKRLEGITDATLEKAEMITAKYAAQHRAMAEAAADLSRENAHLDKVLESQRRTLARIAETIDGQAKRIEDTIVSCVSELENALDGAETKSDAISGGFMERIDRITHAGEFAAGAVSKAADAAREAAEKARNGLVDQAAEARDALDLQLGEARQALHLLCDETGEAVTRQSNATAAGLAEHLTRVKQEIDAQVAEARKTFDGLEGDLGSALARNLKIIDTALQDAETRLEETAERVSDKVRRLSGETSQSVSQLRDAAEDLATRLGQLPKDAGDSAEKVRTAINDQIAEITRIADTAMKTAKDLTQTVDKAEKTAAASLTAREDEKYPQVWDGIEEIGTGRGPRKPANLKSSQIDDLARRIAPRLRPLDVDSRERPHTERSSRNTRSNDREDSGLGWREILDKAERAERASAAENTARTEAADRDHRARASLRIVETLQAMAIDLDRALEEDPPADLLQRYLNGERNVFARRLTMLGGPELTDKIRRKFDDDPEFRHDVNRYISEFESMLDTVTKGDRENILAETYLTSQTGKVYLMLMSATGKR